MASATAAAEAEAAIAAAAVGGYRGLLLSAAGQAAPAFSAGT